MKARDAAQLRLDTEVDAFEVDDQAADELFAVVDVLDAQPPLRRSLSDPSAQAADKEALAERLFSSRISAPAMDTIRSVVRQPWPSGRSLAEALERLGVRALLSQASKQGVLGRVQEELHDVARVVLGTPELDDALRNRRFSLEGRRELVSSLVAERVHPISARLLSRAVAARARTLPLTVQSYLDMAARVGGQQIARVTVARPLDDERRARLQAALERQVSGPVVIQEVVDPDVLGGLNVQLGDHIIESTVAGRLDEARRLLTTTNFSKVGRNG